MYKTLHKKQGSVTVQLRFARSSVTFCAKRDSCGWPPHKTWKWSDARSLLSYGMENYEKTDLYERCQKTEPLPVKVDGGICWGEQPQDHVLAREDLRSEEKHVYALVKKEEKQEKKVFLPKQLQAPVKEGQKIGRVCYYVEGELLREIPL